MKWLSNVRARCLVWLTEILLAQTRSCSHPGKQLTTHDSDVSPCVDNSVCGDSLNTDTSMLGLATLICHHDLLHNLLILRIRREEQIIRVRGLLRLTRDSSHQLPCHGLLISSGIISLLFPTVTYHMSDLLTVVTFPSFVGLIG